MKNPYPIFLSPYFPVSSLPQSAIRIPQSANPQSAFPRCALPRVRVKLSGQGGFLCRRIRAIPFTAQSPCQSVPWLLFFYSCHRSLS
ncbi:MAG: hypothetical protein ACKV2V_21685, partial [Blastocatellia bacterium]